RDRPRGTVSGGGGVITEENRRRVGAQSPPFSKVLVANRGEIAVRIFRTLKELGIGTVAVYSEADRGRLHAEVADEAYLIGPGPPAESYLRGDVVVETAIRSGAEAIHPGYGFLAENAAFARRVEDAGLPWIGPPPAAIEGMGSKIAARRRMQAAGVPVIPGTTEPVETVAELRTAAEEIGYPLAIKASAGGGGKGLKIVAAPEEVGGALESARRGGGAGLARATPLVRAHLLDRRPRASQRRAGA